jgi:hypothetical protein
MNSLASRIEDGLHSMRSYVHNHGPAGDSDLPAQGAIDNPTARQKQDSFVAFQAPHDVEFPAKLLADMFADALMSRIRPEQLQPAPAIVNAMLDQLEQFLQDQLADAVNSAEKKAEPRSLSKRVRLVR